MAEHKQTLTLPFQGPRRYITGVQLTQIATDQVGPDADSALGVACYNMITTNAVQVIRSDSPLSPKAHDTVISLVKDGAPVFVGMRAAGPADPVTAPCFEADVQDAVTVVAQDTGVQVTLANPDHPEGTLLAMLVFAIKRGSQDAFSARGGKWVFAAAKFAQWPADWQHAQATTTARVDARVFQWAVTVDDAVKGTITFYNFETES